MGVRRVGGDKEDRGIWIGVRLRPAFRTQKVTHWKVG